VTWSYSGDPTSSDKDEVRAHDRYVQIAQELRDEYARLQDVGGVVDMTNLLLGQDVDFSIRPLSFAIGMHDNPDAGRQDFGGWYPQVWQIAWPVIPGAE
jgi:hypothetical protein